MIRLDQTLLQMRKQKYGRAASARTARIVMRVMSNGLPARRRMMRTTKPRVTGINCLSCRLKTFFACFADLDVLDPFRLQNLLRSQSSRWIRVKNRVNDIAAFRLRDISNCIL